MREVMIHLRRFLTILTPYKKQLFFLLLASFLIEGMEIAEKYLFKILIDGGTSYQAGVLSENAFFNMLFFIVIAFCLVIIIRLVASWSLEYLIQVIDCSIIADLKRKFFNHIIGLSQHFHTTHKTGSLISKLTRGSRAVESMMDTITFNGLPLLFQFTIVIFSIVYLDRTSAIVILLTTIAFVVFSVAIQQIQLPLRLTANEVEDLEKANIADYFMNISSIKYFAKEGVVGKRYHSMSENTKDAFLRYWKYYRYSNVGQVFILGTGTAALIYFSLLSFFAGTITLGTIVFIYTVAIGLRGPIYRFVQGVRSFYQAMADFESLYQYDTFTNDIIDRKYATKMTIQSGTVDFKNVNFTYHTKQILHEFTLHIKKNERVALVGHSGAGKSTIVKLLYRLYDVPEGEILIDNINITEVQQESLRSSLSIVPQECVLFDDTIYNNILFSRPEATKNEVFAAMNAAQLDRVIEHFPAKEQTIVGERGVKLSGGEKQRVSIARAILANTKLLILDEATSSLDSETEHEIQLALDNLMKGRTTIIIAHRLSTIMNADKIVVIDNGRIVQVGNHKQLIKKKGQYKKLWNLQKGGYIE